ncbi:hypothetical protein N5J77_18885 [Sphingobium yanoikuyae]|uniref:Uncharacterized protein n=1 Tax=Sphingobium yanoikuyae TaxID=13690 RepID=A0AA43B999_SPHYA|nr:hypothetical protein [Sphingobium yanoikuyae]MDH2133201.1 hypothetical protein [Sphingobium yanoikuyae]MDH2149815.1 hypothetical protein [Sphingobium yanoikuyae]MDH2168484.1 hypothetical protein [Sphingobium yanoikuyae]
MIQARTSGGSPVRVVKTRWMIPSCACHSGNGSARAPERDDLDVALGIERQEIGQWGGDGDAALLMDRQAKLGERSISRPRQQKSRPVTGGFLVYQSEEAQASSAGASSASTAISPGSAFGS